MSLRRSSQIIAIFAFIMGLMTAVGCGKTPGSADQASLAIPLNSGLIHPEFIAAPAVRTSCVTSGPQYYVSPSGSDSNSGSSSSPWATIGHAGSTVGAGATVHILPGTYYSSSEIHLSASGTSSARICYISDTPWAAKLVSSASGNSAVLNNSGSYIDIQGLDITDPSGTMGIYNTGNNDRFISNHVHNIAGSGCPQGGGILNYFNAANVEITGNWVHDVGNYSSPCSSIHGIYQSAAGGKITNNIVYRNQSWGIHLWHYATNAIVSNNTVFNNAYGGILIGCGDGGTINNNTLVSNNIVYNNSPSGAPGYGIEEYGITGTGNKYVNNLVYGNKPADYHLQNGLTPTGGVSANPLFVNYTGDGNGDYHLQSTSPAIDHGTSQGAPSIDFDGKSRPAGNGYDIGAYEYGGTASAPAPSPVTTSVSPTPAPTASSSGGSLTSLTTWQSKAIATQSGSFTLQFDAIPSATNMDGVAGLSSMQATTWSDMATIVRFNSSGMIDVRNGANYQAAASVPYSAGTTYHVRMDVNVTNHTYSAYVTPAGGAMQTLGTGLAFRTEQAAVTSLSYFTFEADVGTLTVSNITVSSSGTTASPAPSPVASSTGSVTITSPLNGSTVSSPVQVSASESGLSGVTAMQVYDNGTLVYSTPNTSFSTSLSLAAGSHQLAVKAWYNNGSSNTMSTVTVTVGTSGTSSGTASAATLTPVADTFVRDGTYAANNYGTTTPLEVKDEVTSYDRDAYLKFDLSSVSTINSAKLVIAANLDNATSLTTGIYGVSDTTWTETGMTWNNKPALGNQIASVTLSSTTTAAYTIDLTSYMQSQKAAGKSLVTIAFHDTVSQNTRLTFASREDSANAPKLIINGQTSTTSSPVPVTSPTPTSTSAPAPVSSSTYNFYVSPAGSDSGSGSTTSPWRTISHAVSAAPGANTTIHVAAGSYSETVSFTKSGSSSSHFRIVSDTMWGAKLSGAIQIGSGATSHGGDYVDIVGFDVTAPGSCEGIVTRGTYNQILNNRVHGVALSGCGSGVGGAGIAVFWNGVQDTYQGHTLVSGNLVDQVGNNQYDHGIYVATPYNTVTHNVVSRSTGWGIHVYHYTKNETVSYNTVINNTMGGILISASDGTTDDYTTCDNNIVAFNAGQPGLEEAWGPTGTHNVYQNNLLYQNSGGNLSLQNGLTASGTITSNPLFVNYTGNALTGDYHLQSSSPAYGKNIGAY